MALAVIGFFPSARVSAATSVTLAWDVSSDPAVTGYNLYYGGASGNYTNTVNAGSATSAGVSNLVVGATYYFAATCYNAAGLESDYSVELAYTVPSVTSNVPPSLNLIPDVTINENAGAQTVNLSGISPGAGIGVGNLTIAASSSNQGLVPTPTVAYTNPNPNGTLSFTPTPFGFGTSTITVTANNGGVSNNLVTQTFTVTVNHVNQQPTLNPIGNLTIGENAGPQTVNLTGITSGATNEFQTLTVSAFSSNTGLIPNPAVSYTSPGTTGTLSFTPVTNAFGSASVTVMVDDAGAISNTIIRSFTVTVNQSANTNAPGTNSTPSSWTMWWQSTSGAIGLWTMSNSAAVTQSLLSPARVDPSWQIVGTGKFSTNGYHDLLWQHSAGWVGLWLMDGTNCIKPMVLNSSPISSAWQIVGTGDFAGTGQSDILWQQANGWVGLWLMSGTNLTQAMILNSSPVAAGWKIVGTGDLNGDGKPDILWQHTDGWLGIWLMNGTNFDQAMLLNPSRVAAGWRIAGTADIQGNGQLGIVWRHDSGALGYWLMSGTGRVGAAPLAPSYVEPAWRIAGAQ